MHGKLWDKYEGDLAAADEAASSGGSPFSGSGFQTFLELAEEYDHGNFTFPRIDAGWDRDMSIQPWLIVADPEDAQRIAAHHVKKAGIYQPSFLGEGMLAQTNLDEWQTQRHHLLMGVLPMASLQQVFDIVRHGSKDFGDDLMQLANNGDRIEINELLADKAFKLVGASLFGDEEHFAAHSEAIRWGYIWNLSGFRPLDDTDWTISAARGVVGGRAERELAVELGVLSGELEPGDLREGAEVRKYCDNFAAELLARARSAGANGPAREGSGEVSSVKGPLMAQMEGIDQLDRSHTELGEYPSESEHTGKQLNRPAHNQDLSNVEQSQLDTISTLAFAGHDTTANTMTWFVYEMARNPSVQRKLQAELDEVIGTLGGPLQYTDLPKLPYLTRCVHETLRYWPAVNPGTFREFQYLLRQIFLLILSPFQSTNLFGGAGTTTT